jgi:hypothetical protein
MHKCESLEDFYRNKWKSLIARKSGELIKFKMFNENSLLNDKIATKFQERLHPRLVII